MARTPLVGLASHYSPGGRIATSPHAVMVCRKAVPAGCPSTRELLSGLVVMVPSAFSSLSRAGGFAVVRSPCGRPSLPLCLLQPCSLAVSPRNHTEEHAGPCDPSPLDVCLFAMSSNQWPSSLPCRTPPPLSLRSLSANLGFSKRASGSFISHQLLIVVWEEDVGNESVTKAPATALTRGREDPITPPHTSDSRFHFTAAGQSRGIGTGPCDSSPVPAGNPTFSWWRVLLPHMPV